MNDKENLLVKHLVSLYTVYSTFNAMYIQTLMAKIIFIFHALKIKGFETLSTEIYVYFFAITCARQG